MNGILQKRNFSPAADRSQALVHMENISKVYAPGTPEECQALQDISLEIERGEFISITGTSGSGKSTLMRIIGCRERPTGGEYCFSGKPVRACSGKELSRLRRRKIAMIPQNYCLNEGLTVWENVAQPLSPNSLSYSERRRRVNRALHYVGLAQKSECMPGHLSGGQRQRVAIARAAVQNPELILADEPTGALDAETKEYVFQLFRRLNDDGVTVILVTHDYSVAARAHRMIRVQDGQIHEDRILANAV